jgi:hypothetical protein
MRTPFQRICGAARAAAGGHASATITAIGLLASAATAGSRVRAQAKPDTQPGWVQGIRPRDKKSRANAANGDCLGHVAGEPESPLLYEVWDRTARTAGLSGVWVCKHLGRTEP